MQAGLSLAASGLGWFLALILARASWHKLTDFYRAVGVAMDYRAVSDAWVPGIVRLLGLAEAIWALGRLFPVTRPAAGLAAAMLFAAYGLLMARVMGQGRVQIDCGCGGPPQPVSGYSLLRNAVLAAAGGAVALMPGTATGPGGLLLGLGLGLTLLGSYALLEKFASYLPQIRQVRRDMSKGSMQWTT